MSRFSRADVLALENHPDPQVRRYAAELRDKLDAERRTPPVMLLPGRCIRTVARGLEHRSAEARQAAAEALGRFGDAAIAEAATRLLSPRPEVAHAAILALGSIGSGAPGGCCSTICARCTGRRTITCMGWPPCAASALG